MRRKSCSCQESGLSAFSKAMAIRWRRLSQTLYRLCSR